MPGKKPTSGLRLYALLLREVSEINSELPARRQLSLKERRDFISQKIYPLYKDKPAYKFRVTEARESIKKKIKRPPKSNRKMPGNKPTSGLGLYALLLHEVSEINRELPARRQLSLKERRDFISQKIYPIYKDKAGYKFRVTEARESIRKKIKRLPKRDNEDPSLIPEEEYDSIDYYSIDFFLSELLKDWSINIKLVAGPFGETEIFNTRDYNYKASGVADITNEINEYVRKRPRRAQSGTIFYTGQLQVMPGRKNDGRRDSYYLEMVLQQGSATAKKLQPIQLPQEKSSKKKKQRARKKKKAKEVIQKRVKKIKFSKSKTKTIRQSILKLIDFYKNLLKNKYIAPKDKKQYAKVAYKNEKAKLDKYLKSGTITQGKYTELLNKIKKGYGHKG